MSLTRLWPPAGLRAVAGDLELRWIDDALLADLAELAARGVHAPDSMPFSVPWTRGTPEEVARSVLTYQWGARADVGPSRLRLELAVVLDGEPVGIQAAGGENWAVLRQVETGSWLGAQHQGLGIGSRMRALMLELLFDGLGAAVVRSAAFTDNAASNAVSRRVGYLDDGEDRLVREGAVAIARRYVLARERWLAVRAANLEMLGAPVLLEGVRAVREMIEG